VFSSVVLLFTTQSYGLCG